MAKGFGQEASGGGFAAIAGKRPRTGTAPLGHPGKKRRDCLYRSNRSSGSALLRHAQAFLSRGEHDRLRRSPWRPTHRGRRSTRMPSLGRPISESSSSSFSSPSSVRDRGGLRRWPKDKGMKQVAENSLISPGNG